MEIILKFELTTVEVNYWAIFAVLDSYQATSQHPTNFGLNSARMTTLRRPDSLLTTACVMKTFVFFSFSFQFTLLISYDAVHGNDLSGNRGEIASPLFPHPYIHRDDFSWRVTVDAERFVRLYFYPQFSIEREHESTACISSLLVLGQINELRYIQSIKNDYDFYRYMMDTMNKLLYWENTVEKPGLDQCMLLLPGT